MTNVGANPGYEPPDPDNLPVDPQDDDGLDVLEPDDDKDSDDDQAEED